MRATQHVRMVLGALGVSTLSLIPLDGRAETSGIKRKCEVFSSARDKARCACALEQGGWVTEVQGKWRWIYPRRHQERHCHGQSGSLGLSLGRPAIAQQPT
jgi:hypothetical protein